MVTCLNCKEPVREGAKFCATCGAPQSFSAPSRPVPPAPASAATASAATASAATASAATASAATAAAAATRPLGSEPLTSAPPTAAAQQTARTVPGGAQTRQLVPAGTNTSGPRPVNAVIGDAYRITALLHNNAGRMIYSVNTFPATPEAAVLQCPSCGAIHWKEAYAVNEMAYPPAVCDRCLNPLDTGRRPNLVAIEVFDPKLLFHAPEAVPLLLCSKSVRAPIYAATEMVCGRARTVLVEPRVEQLPEKAERSQALKWFADLVDGLDYLHSRGVSFNGQSIASSLGLDGENLVWAHFTSFTVGAISENARRGDVRSLAAQLWRWLTGREQFAPDGSLSAGENAFFAQALNGPGFSSVAEMTNAFDQSQVQARPQVAVEFRTGRRTDVGRVRQLNEDSLLTIETALITTSNPHPAGVYVVADGMGGHSAGEVASGAIVNFIQTRCLGELSGAINNTGIDWLAWVKQTVELVNKHVFDMRKTSGTDMGSTLVMAMLDGARAYVSHIGDSRAYQISKSEIRRLTVDHSLVERLVATGQIRPEEAQNHPQKNVIYRTIGDKPRLDIEANAFDLAVGDRLMLCSDGLSGLVTDDVIFRIVSSAADSQSACDALVTAANNAGGDDNISVVIVQIVQA